MDKDNQLLKLKRIKEDIALQMFNSKENTFSDLKILNIFFDLLENILKLLQKLNNAIFIYYFHKNVKSLPVDNLN